VQGARRIGRLGSAATCRTSTGGHPQISRITSVWCVAEYRRDLGALECHRPTWAPAYRPLAAGRSAQATDWRHLGQNAASCCPWCRRVGCLAVAVHSLPAADQVSVDGCGTDGQPRGLRGRPGPATRSCSAPWPSVSRRSSRQVETTRPRTALAWAAGGSFLLCSDGWLWSRCAAPLMTGRPPELGTQHVERVTGIEPALSAWESERNRLSWRLTCQPVCPLVAALRRS